VAALPDASERIPLMDASGHKIEAEAYLVEAQTLEGLSGSPVFTKEPLILVDLGKHHGEHAGAYGALVLLGLYVGSWDGYPGEILATDKGLRSNKIRVPVGMGVVVPAQKILEVLRGDSRLNAYRKRRVDAVKAARSAANERNLTSAFRKTKGCFIQKAMTRNRMIKFGRHVGRSTRKTL